jgi:hypothetical protein
MRRAGLLGLLVVLAVVTAACGSQGNPTSAPTTAAGNSASTTTSSQPITAPSTSTTPTLPPPTSAEETLLEDLSNAKTATQTATNSLTATESTDSAPTLSEMSSSVAPVFLDLTAAAKQLTATMPTLPANPLVAEEAQTLSTGLTGDLQDLNEVPGLVASIGEAASADPAVSSAMVAEEDAEARTDYIDALGLVNETFAGIVPEFLKALELSVNLQ